jgi:hypothetical protein
MVSLFELGAMFVVCSLSTGLIVSSFLSVCRVSNIEWRAKDNHLIKVPGDDIVLGSGANFQKEAVSGNTIFRAMHDQYTLVVAAYPPCSQHLAWEIQGLAGIGTFNCHGANSTQSWNGILWPTKSRDGAYFYVELNPKKKKTLDMLLKRLKIVWRGHTSKQQAEGKGETMQRTTHSKDGKQPHYYGATRILLESFPALSVVHFDIKPQNLTNVNLFLFLSSTIMVKRSIKSHFMENIEATEIITSLTRLCRKGFFLQQQLLQGQRQVRWQSQPMTARNMGPIVATTLKNVVPFQTRKEILWTRRLNKTWVRKKAIEANSTSRKELAAFIQKEIKRGVKKQLLEDVMQC